MNASVGWDIPREQEASTRIEKHSKLLECFLFVSYSLAAAILLGTAWHGPEYSFLGIFGIGFFLHGQLNQRRLRWRLLHSAIFGYATFAFANFWMAWTIESTAPISVTEAKVYSHLIHLFHGGMFVLFSFCGWLVEKMFRNGWLLLPLVFVAAEAVWPSLFPFRQGCLLAGFPSLIQVVSVFGISAASFQVFVLGSFFPLTAACFRRFENQLPLSRNQAQKTILVALLITFCNLGWGQWRIGSIEWAESRDTNEQFSALVVQNDTEYAAYHVDLVSHSRKLGDECNLIVWPECSIGHFDRKLTSFSDFKKLSKLCYGYGSDSVRPLPNPNCHLLAGGYSSTRITDASLEVVETNLDDTEEELTEPVLESKFVTAFLISPEEEIVGKHDKIKLMAGGEYTPAKGFLSRLSQLLLKLGLADEEAMEAAESEFEPSNHPLSCGAVAEPIGIVDQVAIGTMLCCEDMYSSISRELTVNGADILVCLANGASFNERAALHQHFIISRFRAIENNRYLLRCGSVGVSALINPAGKAIKKTPCFENHQMKIEIPIKKRQLSLFSQFGSWPLFAILGLGYFAIGRSAWLHHHDTRP